MPVLEAAVLSAGDVRTLARHATESGFASLEYRELLLYGIPPAVRNSWPQFQRPTAQIFSDLAQANTRREYIFAWLSNAELLDPESGVWSKAREYIDRRQRISPTAQRHPQSRSSRQSRRDGDSSPLEGPTTAASQSQERSAERGGRLVRGSHPLEQVSLPHVGMDGSEEFSPVSVALAQTARQRVNRH